MILNSDTKKLVEGFLNEVVSIGINFKLQENVNKARVSSTDIGKIVTDLPTNGMSLIEILDEFKEHILPYCTNFSSAHFMGFPDSGNSAAALGGAVLSDFLQQNLINQSFCAPSATFVEIAVLQWLREAVGYKRTYPKDIWGVGGIITPGGTVSNAVGMMLARENKQAGTLENGVSSPSSFKVVVPKGIGHYSVKSAQMWIGCGHNLIEVETDNFRYDLDDLECKLKENKGEIMAVVAYAGDSRTMTVDNLDKVADLVHIIDSNIWLHADACHGFSLGFSSELRHKIKGIEKFDSISTDPHKVMMTPYTISALLVKDPENLKKITSLSDLIMQEEYAFGQITPFLGSKSWMSLKLWFMMKNFGKNGLDELITKRHYFAVELSSILKSNKNFMVLNDVEINSVAFFFTAGRKHSVAEINRINRGIHQRMLEEGKCHLHQFSIPDRGIFKKGEIVYPLRFMSGNPNTSKKDLHDMIEYVQTLGNELLLK
ncbi:TPA: pyridoxal-dependent decarboxylase [Patescibacteria group bacterium]|nr:MAG: Pyridoxal-dependent decarboxylase [Parcubacteria group bacterium GW2011_GWF2_40_10]KKR46706.1 MAG: Pyridoxal-dependent decarboxylase [Parcubacteria group bacterium GW2011_GWA2_40_143]KKR59390.1 MAG: Pyridoxal-dependent decarboxylase [Parcubacteria group bacterium GW2011_GWC2_40_31]KKR74433.1 MAG: Pyridoxal-dependent decarboxylase [Parcubacteria group bacterium GW2011_GWB2_40_8]KKR75968.1 MAG: Pyridoxal-dependent decarboxylase [Parcubacteria group bacterium GW2011_GWE2_40_8]KKR82221.1 M